MFNIYMDISYLSLFIFILITILYYTVPSIGKYPLTLPDIELTNGDPNPDGFAEYYKKNFSRISLYVLATVVTQFILNTTYLINKCGGSSSKNIGAAALFTFIPWVFIFGVMVATIFIFPGFKSAFADVIGYFCVANSANDILSAILINTDAEDAINKSDIGQLDKSTMTKSAEAIMKMCGNKSIIINQMNPENFLNVWNILKPLMKNQGNIDGINEHKTNLFNLVILKDNIGEAFWYVYGAILISSIVYYNLATRGCIKDVNAIKASHDEYLKEQEALNAKKKLNDNITYTS